MAPADLRREVHAVQRDQALAARAPHDAGDVAPGHQGVAVHPQEALAQPLRAADPSLNLTITPFFSRQPFEVAPEAALVQVCQQAVTTVRGTPPALTGQTPWMDSALLAAAGVETVVLGPTGAGAHAAEEWVDLQSVGDLAQALVLAAEAYCA